MSDDVRRKVQNWLQKTGYPLEMRVAQAARRANPLWVDQSRNYLDAQSGKVRETDVVVGWGDRRGQSGGYVYLVIECKARPAPWVVFDDGDLPTDDPEQRLWWTAFRTPDDPFGNVRPISVRPDAFTGDTLLGPSRVGTAVVEATFSEKTTERNMAWDAVRSAVSAAHGLLSEFSPSKLRRDEAALAAFPVVVTSGALFRSYLDGSEVAVEEVDRAEVRARIDNQWDENRCLIVTESALPRLFAQAEKTWGLVTLGP